MNDKRAKDIMTTDVIVANKNDIIANVANLLIKEKIGGLPVVDEENKVVGIISETDIMKKESHVDSPRMLNFIQGIIFLDDMKKFEDEMRAIAAYKVEDLMSKDIIKENENAVGILMSFGMGCVGCPSSQMETIEQACSIHGLDLEEVLAKLNEK